MAPPLTLRKELEISTLSLIPFAIAALLLVLLIGRRPRTPWKVMRAILSSAAVFWVAVFVSMRFQKAKQAARATTDVLATDSVYPPCNLKMGESVTGCQLKMGQCVCQRTDNSEECAEPKACKYVTTAP